MQIEQVGRFFIYAWAEKGSDAWLGHWLISMEKHGDGWHPHGREVQVCAEPCLSERIAELDAYMVALSTMKSRIVASG